MLLCSLIPGQKDLMPEMTVNPKDDQHPTDKMLATTFQGTRSIKVLEVPKPVVTDPVSSLMMSQHRKAMNNEKDWHHLQSVL